LNYFSGEILRRGYRKQVLKLPSTNTQRQKNTITQAPEKCTDWGMVTVSTAVQQIMTGLQTADTEGNRLAVIMGAVYGLDMPK
jgi:DhnA family fructose-bisphosphate aldolase class Ia